TLSASLNSVVTSSSDGNTEKSRGSTTYKVTNSTVRLIVMLTANKISSSAAGSGITIMTTTRTTTPAISMSLYLTNLLKETARVASAILVLLCLRGLHRLLHRRVPSCYSLFSSL